MVDEIDEDGYYAIQEIVYGRPKSKKRRWKARSAHVFENRADRDAWVANTKPYRRQQAVETTTVRTACTREEAAAILPESISQYGGGLVRHRMYAPPTGMSGEECA